MNNPALTTPEWGVLGSVRCALGESPFWHPQEQTLYWVDITAKQLLRANVYTADVDTWDMPCEPGCIAPAVNGGLVIALRDGVYRAPQWGGALTRIAVLPYDPATVRANDGKCDAVGRFWVGTVDETKAAQAAALYSVDARPEPAGNGPLVQQHASGALTANGLAWSPDNRTIYWADTPRHHVLSWPFDLQANQLGAQRTHLQFATKPAGWQPGQAGQPSYAGRPDGATVDALGNYWVALYEGQRVCQFAPDGRLLRQFQTPMQCPTMPCLGGEDLRTLYLTSVSQGRPLAELAQMPNSGAVVFTRVETPGLPVNYFQD